MKITPEAVVARYKELGVKPMFGSMNLIPDENNVMVLADPEFGCCALGVMGLGTVIGPDASWIDKISDNCGVRFWDFVDGFDGHPLPEQFRDDGIRARDYELGKACRAAVEAEFGPIGKIP